MLSLGRLLGQLLLLLLLLRKLLLLGLLLDFLQLELHILQVNFRLVELGIKYVVVFVAIIKSPLGFFGSRIRLSKLLSDRINSIGSLHFDNFFAELLILIVELLLEFYFQGIHLNQFLRQLL